MSSLPRPAKRLRSSSGSKPTLIHANLPVPLLFRNLDPALAVIKCLEAIATERLLRQSDLIDRVITDTFLGKIEPQNRNRTNIKEAKSYICRQIGPVLYQLITSFIDSLDDSDGPSPTQASPVTSQRKVSQSQAANATIGETSPSTNLGNEPKKAASALVPPFSTSLDHATPRAPTVELWLQTGNSAFPFRQNYGLVQPLQIPRKLTLTPPEEPNGALDFQFPETVKSNPEANTEVNPEGSTPASNKSTTQVKAANQEPEPSIGETTNAATDRQETRGVASVVRGRIRSAAAIRTCSFCAKPLPSPSARREHESIHIYQLCQYKQFQCKHPNCQYRSHRPREVIHHMKNRHDWKPQGRRFSIEDLIDHGPLSEDKMVTLRYQYQTEKAYAAENGGMSTLLPSEDGKAAGDNPADPDFDDLMSHNNTLISMDYSFTQPQLQSHVPPQISSSMFGMESHLDDANSLEFMVRDKYDQLSQVDYQIHEYMAFRNSIGQFPTQTYLPQAQGPQLIGVGAHARSLLTGIDIPSTLDVEEDAQGENEVEWSKDAEWSEAQVVNTMKGG
ncbi:hypothetical protein Dda_6752 [Drechslerella dactyloides]|uniref:C2H2-type domain-containing protein n=1 Tax=Drechslerella dactyloides TaxID=74499 RepID=A0AAD6IYE3_DREDA|nr:hypothetical protein Dda_6752 [Drechslerella dactyloides]